MNTLTPDTILEERVRLKPRTATDEEIQKINQQKGRTGARRLEPADAAIKRLKNQKTANDDRFCSWLTHPDERVQIALADQWPEAGWWQQDRNGRSQRSTILLQRALQQAQQEELCWTPVLDRIATRGAYPWNWPSDRTAQMPSPDKVLEPLNDLIYRAEDFEDIKFLLEFTFPKIREWLAVRPDLPAEAIDELQETHWAMNHVGAQERLEPGVAERTFEWVIDTLHQARQIGEQPSTETEEETRKYWDQQARACLEVLGRLLRKHNLQLTQNQTRQLLDTMPEPTPRSPRSTGARGTLQGYLWFHYLQQPAFRQQMNAEDKRRLYRNFRRDPRAGKIMSWESMNEELWEETLDWLPRAVGWHAKELKKGLADHPRAITESTRVRTFLLESANSPDLIKKVARKSPDDDTEARNRACERVLEIAEGTGDILHRKQALHVGPELARNNQDLKRLYLGTQDMHTSLRSQLVRRILCAKTARLPDLALFVLEETRSPKIRKAVLQVRQARTHPEVRQALIDTEDRNLLDLLLEEADAEELQALFGRLAGKDAERAGEKLDDLTDEQIEKLQRSDLTPLLQAENREIRLKALMAASQVEKEEKENKTRSQKSNLHEREQT